MPNSMMGILIASVLVVLLFVLAGYGWFRKYVAPEKIRWYDLLVVIALLFAIEGINYWVIRLGVLGSAAYALGVGLYAIEVIDTRPMPKVPKG